MPNTDIENIVCQGGSVKGVAYLGAICELEKHINFSNVKRVAGTSAGAITALVLAMGCTGEMTKELLKDFDFKDILDDKKGGIPTAGKVLKTVEKSENNQFFAKGPAKTVKLPITHRLRTQLGVYEGDYIREWMEDLIQKRVKEVTNEKYDGKNLTFKQLHALTQEYPGKFRDLYVTGVNLNTSESSVFSCENPKMEDVIISDAVRISMSIPGVFKPHHVYYNINGERMVDARRDIWVDGGLFDNYPIFIFDKEELNQRTYNSKTLGMRLVSKEKLNYFSGLTDDAPQAEIDGLVAFAKALASASLRKQDSDHQRCEGDKARTIYIDHLNVSTLAFNLSEAQKDALMQSAQRAVQLYFTGNSEVLVPNLGTDTVAREPLAADLQKSRCVIL